MGTATAVTGATANTLPENAVYIDPVTGEVVTEKTCAHCHLSKPLIAFHHKTKGKYGRQEWCKRCANKKTPMTWEEEQAGLLAAAQSSRREDASPVDAVKSTAKNTVAVGSNADDEAITETFVASISDFLGDINDVDEAEAEATEHDDYVMTGSVSAEKMGEVEFADWFKSDLPVFSNALVTVIRVENSFAIYTNAAIRVPNYVPTGVISDTRYLELIVRTLADNVGRAPAVYGFSYQ